MEDFEGALQRTEEYRRMAEITQSRSAFTEYLMYLAVIHSSRDRKEDLEQSMKYVQKAIRLARKEPFIYGEYSLWNIRAQIAQKMGRSEEALKYSQQASDLFQKQPHEEEMGVEIQFTRYQILKDLGRLQEAEEALSESFGILKKLAKNIESEEFRKSFWEVPLRRRVAEAAREVGLESSQK
ncbi:MAG: hypothetical protein HYW07_20070 [Candidatus Latescibacteria bacterium]|nr:hypothetical protein [Candidatus Latescibacterota bacterium]